MMSSSRPTPAAHNDVSDVRSAFFACGKDTISGYGRYVVSTGSSA